MTADTSLDRQDPKSGSNRSLWTGIFLAILGVVALILPVFSTIVTATWVAFILLTAGFSKAIFAFQTKDKGGLIWKVLLSVLYIGAGATLLLNPLTGVITITLLLGSFLLTEGVFELILAFRLRPQQNWTWVLGNALVTLLLGGIVWSGWPSNAPWLLGTAVGASVLATGVSRTMICLNARTSGTDDSDQLDQAASA
ncbi:HdeD family acid-resistance protein [Pseudanabaena sp. FACHB-2040]|uniref:HdeD family acid-resistance protein n=1 Tax=Pseudanabaena sp. FACHB-2040 TaxID=2692859 RepID=UPI001687AC11|nr:HdeD family acid-resistance protein [Pseudanabaena sp. FACHB-2040]MBD2256544.1 HdeD family acid-resistance protein [Pseudanabaena sp. FACHB-2040]